MTSVPEFVDFLSSRLSPGGFISFVTSVSNVITNSMGIEDWLAQLPSLLQDAEVFSSLLSFLQLHGTRSGKISLTDF